MIFIDKTNLGKVGRESWTEPTGTDSAVHTLHNWLVIDWQFIRSVPTSQRRAVVARQVHILKVAGSSPAAATTFQVLGVNLNP